MELTSECPLCGATDNTLKLQSADMRTFTLCEICKLIYIDRTFLPENFRERERYLEHNNDSDSEGYRSFLRRVLDPLLPYMPTGAACLDYGCGPIPVLAEVVRSEGFTCWAYDPIFYPDGLVEAAAELGLSEVSNSSSEVDSKSGSDNSNVLDPIDTLSEAFDVVFSTECFEHFHQPAQTISEIMTMVKKGGYLGIMSEVWTETDRFSSWYYTRDDTHVIFFHEETFDWLCAKHGLRRIWSDGKRTTILQKLG
jgi:2-polyprenyl-3-methyl-5-hydroxy-6-metoxy-1,4-benzoquinol methylase